MASQHNGFYMTVVSNASMDLYPENTQAVFRNILNEPLDLKNYEVALVEISYTETWFNVQDDFDALFISKEEEATDPLTKAPIDLVNSKSKPINQLNIKVEKGYYPTNKSFFEYLNKKLAKHAEFGFGDKTFNYIGVRQEVEINLPKGVNMLLSKTMCEVTGFESKLLGGYRMLQNLSDVSKVIKPEYGCDIHRGLYTFFIYCDLVKPQMVGEQRVPLLRNVGIKTRKGVKQVTETFNSPHYMPLSKQYFENIEVHIKDDQGQPISFQRGKTLVKLHLRPCAPHYL